MTGVSECSQQRDNLKDNGYKYTHLIPLAIDTYFDAPLTYNSLLL
ncbi:MULTISPECIES: hypothetical protein [Photorhabdus]|nr:MULTISPECIES: hypothetical protein [Photorhabdus]